MNTLYMHAAVVSLQVNMTCVHNNSPHDENPSLEMNDKSRELIQFGGKD